MPLRLRADSPVWEEWTSSIITAKDLLFSCADSLGNHAEFLYGGDDDVLAGFEESSELRRVLVNAVNDAFHLFRLLDGLLELLVEHAPISDHNHGVEDAVRIRRGAVEMPSCRCASQAIEFDLPLPVACWMR